MSINLFEAGARFDPSRTYRYLLWRRWGPGRTVCWVMLNPSTADESALDPTLRRCKDYTARWGFDGFEVVNLYALRSTDPKGLWRVPDPVGCRNNATIYEATRRAALVLLGWGGKAKPDRVREVAKLLPASVHCLKTTNNGSPWHPLYLPKVLKPQLWILPSEKPLGD